MAGDPQELVDQGKAASVKMEQLQQSVHLLQAARAWAGEAAQAIEGLPTLAQVQSSSLTLSVTAMTL